MNDKQRVAEYAAEKIESGMRVGLGTGSTANYFIEALARRQRQEGLRIQVVSSSIASAIKAQQLGLELLGMEHIGHLDVYVDGADEVAPDFTLLKGRGADLVREKLLAKAAKAFWVLIDAGKWVQHIGQHFPIPIEVMPFAWQLVQRSLAEIGGNAQLRKNGDGLFVTSYGSLVLDAAFSPAPDAQSLNVQLNAVPGVVEHGVFTGLADRIFCADNGEITEHVPSA